MLLARLKEYADERIDQPPPLCRSRPSSTSRTARASARSSTWSRPSRRMSTPYAGGSRTSASTAAMWRADRASGYCARFRCGRNDSASAGRLTSLSCVRASPPSPSSTRSGGGVRRTPTCSSARRRSASRRCWAPMSPKARSTRTPSAGATSSSSPASYGGTRYCWRPDTGPVAASDPAAGRRRCALPTVLARPRVPPAGGGAAGARARHAGRALPPPRTA